VDANCTVFVDSSSRCRYLHVKRFVTLFPGSFLRPHFWPGGCSGPALS